MKDSAGKRIPRWVVKTYESLTVEFAELRSRSKLLKASEPQFHEKTPRRAFKLRPRSQETLKDQVHAALTVNLSFDDAKFGSFQGPKSQKIRNVRSLGPRSLPKVAKKWGRRAKRFETWGYWNRDRCQKWRKSEADEPKFWWNSKEFPCEIEKVKCQRTLLQRKFKKNLPKGATDSKELISRKFCPKGLRKSEASVSHRKIHNLPIQRDR